MRAEIERWEEALKHPDWYIVLEDFLRSEIFPINHSPQVKERRHLFYGTVEQALQRKGGIKLAENTEDKFDLDAGREEIDTVVIHHTEEVPGISLERLSAIGLVRQYAKMYLEDNLYGLSGVRGKPIWSGHFDASGKVVFYAYHRLIRPYGASQRLLEDSEIGFHAGSKNMNQRSIALAMSGNFQNSSPNELQLREASRLISEYPNTRVMGHRDVMPGRDCPGDLWNQWKSSLC